MARASVSTIYVIGGVTIYLVKYGVHLRPAVYQIGSRWPKDELQDVEETNAGISSKGTSYFVPGGSRGQGQ
jgi:hypothetical protein